MTMEILLLEDDPQLVRLLASIFKREGYEILECLNIDQAKSLLRQRHVDLALVDLMLGQEDGLDFIRYAREKRPGIGIVVMSAKSSSMDRVVGIEVGADDYLTKPLDLRELLARVRRLFKRLHLRVPDRTDDRLTVFSGFTLDKRKRTLEWGKRQPVALTGKEFDLLVFLAESENRVLSRDAIAIAVYGRSWNALDRSVDVMVSNLRSKLRCFNPAETLIKSVRGVGYSFGALVEKVDRLPVVRRAS